MTHAWDSEASFSIDHLAATRAQRCGDESLMDTLTARMEALERDRLEFFPGSPDGMELGGRESEALGDWDRREQEARTAVRVESRPCGCRVHYNNIDEAILADPQCTRMARCRDLDQQRRHMVDGVQLDC